jgi:hypothetical protein
VGKYEHPYVWDRQSGESRQAYQAFTHYRDQGAERSGTRTAAGLGKARSLILRWSSKWAWVARCEAWDAELEREAQLRARKVARERGEVIVKQALFMQSIGLRRLTDVVQDPAQLKTVSPRDAMVLVVEGVKMEKTERGEPSEISVALKKTPTTIGYDALSTEELERLGDLLDKVEAATPGSDAFEEKLEQEDAVAAAKRLGG